MQIQACLGYAERQGGRRKAMSVGRGGSFLFLIPNSLSTLPLFIEGVVEDRGGYNNSSPVYRGGVQRTEGFIPHSSSKKKILPHNSLNSSFTLIFPSYTKSTIYRRFSLIIVVRRNIQHLHTNRISRTFINNHIFLLKSLFSCYKSCLF